MGRARTETPALKRPAVSRTHQDDRIMGESARLETQAASGCPESSRAAFEVRSMSFDSFGLVSLVPCVVCLDAHQSSSV